METGCRSPAMPIQIQPAPVMNIQRTASFVTAIAVVSAQAAPVGKSPFQDDVDFLKKHVDVIVLRDGETQVAVVPAYQGRVMTSTVGGEKAPSFGWINRELIASGKRQPHINAFGGEDRFWLGPEGGQFSIFFAKGASFDLEHWFTPAPLDIEPFDVTAKSERDAEFHRAFTLTNMSGTKFAVDVVRKVSLMTPARVAGLLDTPIPAGVKLVAIETANTLKNAGSAPWTKDSGLLSVWILGMFNASPACTVVIPFHPGSEEKLGPVVNDTYFGKVPPDRLVVRKDVLFFKADAKSRSKIGIPPRRAKDLLGSYDAMSGVLTICQYTLPKDAKNYVNSMWEFQKDPFSGDVVNSYNDGIPTGATKQLGNFYELETSSPGLALAPGGQTTHIHRTIHLQGSEQDLEGIARKTLGVGLADIRAAMK
jgi:hypothetical protein